MELKLIDFGICRTYLEENGAHIEEGSQAGEGNVAFASVTSLQNQRISRRDDLFSLYLVLVYLRTGKIPGGTSSILRCRNDFIKLRLNTDPLDYCDNDDCRFLKQFFLEIAFTQFKQEPNYGRLRYLLAECLIQ